MEHPKAQARPLSIATGSPPPTPASAQGAPLVVPRTSLDEWAALLAVVDCGGFAQAAQALHKSQSSVSYQVTKLQEQLDVPLLRIRGRKAELTEVGRSLLQRARWLLREAAAIERQAADHRRGWEREIVLLMDALCPETLALDALHRFEQSAHSATRVRLEEIPAEGALSRLLAGDVDLLIGAEVPDGYRGDPLCQIEFLPVAHRDHPLARLERPINEGDLLRERQIVSLDMRVLHQKTQVLAQSDAFWMVSNVDKALAAVRRALGFAWLPRHRIAAALDEGELYILPINAGAPLQLMLYLTLAGRESTGPGARLLSDFLQKAACSDEVTAPDPIAPPLFRGIRT
ncbi:MAG: LysR family transcriptional regulator [Chromatiaceae bacterium]|nr:LysR family transcriptional regulator [Chromatiaceae bacterium]